MLPSRDDLCRAAMIDSGSLRDRQAVGVADVGGNIAI